MKNFILLSIVGLLTISCGGTSSQDNSSTNSGSTQTGNAIIATTPVLISKVPSISNQQN